MAELPRNYDPDVPAGAGNGLGYDNAYSSLAALLVAEAVAHSDLAGDGDNLVCRGRASANNPDTTAASISGYTVASGSNIKITGIDYPHTGKWTTTGQSIRHEVDDAHVLDNGENYTEIEWVQLGAGGTTNFRYGINFTGHSGGTDKIHHNIIRQMDAQTAIGIYLASGGASAATSVDIYNNYIYDFAANAGIRISDADFTGDSYNNTIAGCSVGINRTDGTMASTDDAVFDNGDDFSANITINNAASDDGDGNNPQTLVSTDNYAGEFTAYTGTPSDVHLVLGSVCIGNGSTGNDIGAYAYVAPSAGAIMNQFQKNNLGADLYNGSLI